MSSSKTFFTLVCMLALTLLLRGETPNANPATKTDDSRSSDSSSDMQYKPPEKIGGKRMKQWLTDLGTRGDPAVRAAAIVALLQFGDTSIVPDLVNLINRPEPDTSVRIKAVVALGLLPIPKAHRERAIKCLANVIKNDLQSVIRYEAIKSLMQFQQLKGEERVSTIPALVANVNAHGNYELRILAIKALMIAGPDKTGPEASVINALILHVLPSQELSAEVRLNAIMALGSLGRPNNATLVQTIIRNLRSAAETRNRAIRIWSHVALLVLDADNNYEKELQEIVKTLEDVPEAAMKKHALMALAALKENSNKYVPNICRVLRKEKDASVRSAGAMALGFIGNKGEQVINTLIRITEDEDPEHFDAVMAACVAFTQLGANTPEVVKAMDNVIKRPINKYQKQAIRKLKEELKNPKKTEKDQPKSPEKDIRTKPAPERRP
jgi:HEAT repeat protein